MKNNMENENVKLNFKEFCDLYFNIRNSKFIYEIKKILFIDNNKLFVISNEFITNSVNNNIENKLKKLKNTSFYIDDVYYEKDNDNVLYFISLYPVDLKIFFNNLSKINNDYSKYFFKIYKELPYKNINNLYGVKILKNEYNINDFKNIINKNNIVISDTIKYNNINYKYILFNDNDYLYILFKIDYNLLNNLIKILNKNKIKLLRKKLFVPINENPIILTN